MEPDIRKLIVKIKLVNDHATGMIVSLPDNKEEDLIITVFHLFENFNGDNESIYIESNFDHTKKFNITRILYERSDREKNDIALIFVRKLTWITIDDNMLIPEKNKKIINSEVFLAGFPLKIEEENLDIPYLPLNGKIIGYSNDDNSRYMVKLNDPKDPEISLYDAIKGMSGCPVYMSKDGRLYFVGIQKNVPSKEISYNITNVLCYDWCINIIHQLYDVAITFDTKPIDETQYKNLQYFKNYYNKSRQQSGTYYLNQINKHLFPSIANDFGIKYYNENQQEVALITYLNKVWNGEKSINNKGVLITGEGGSGKTVSLLETCEYCLNNNIFAVYIPINLLRVHKGSSIKKYLIDFIWNGSEHKADHFIQSLNNNSNNNKPGLVLLLDGFNELIEENKINIVKDIDNWVNKPNIQVIITSRYNLKNTNAWLPQLEHLNIQPLKVEQVNEYLLACNLKIPKNDKLMKLLQIPMMLTLYANTEGQFLNNQMVSGINWKKDKINSGTIIWNYIQCQLIKVMSSNLSSIEIIEHVYALEYVSSYIGYKMQQDSLFSIKEDTFAEWIEDAIEYYDNLWENKYSLRIKSLERLNSCRHKNWDSIRIYNILTRELHIFILSADGTISLLHQQFRDFFSANYYIEVLRNYEGFLGEFGKKPIDYYVLNFISEIVDNEFISKVLDKMRNKIITSEDYTIFNMIQIYYRIKRNDRGKIDFTDINFDYIDLRKVSLCGIKLSSNQNKASFRKAKISNYTFYSERHMSSIYCIVYSPDGKRALSGSSDNTIREWDLSTGECINVLIEDTKYIESLDYSPDGKKALSGSFNGRLIEWDLITGKVIQSLEGHSAAVYGVKYSFDGTKAISGSFDNMLMEWDLNEGKCIQSIKCSNNGIRGLDYSPDGTKAITASYDGKVREWDLVTGTCIQSLIEHKGAVRHVCYAADGKKVLSCSDDCTIKEWDLTTKKRIHNLVGHDSKVCTVSYSPNGTKVLSCSYDGTIREWDLASEECIRIIKGYGYGYSSMYCVEYSPDGKRALSGSSSISIEEWDLDTSENIQIIKGYYGRNLRHTNSILQNNTGLSYWDNNHDVSWGIWDLNKKKCIYMVNDLFNGKLLKWNFQCVAYFSEENKALFRGDYLFDYDYVEERNLRTGEVIQKLETGKNINQIGCYSLDGKRALLTSNKGRDIQEWDLENGKLIQVLKGHKKSINVINYSIDNHKAYSCSEDKTIFEWNLTTGKNKMIYRVRNKINALAFSLDKKIMVTCSKDGIILEWDMIKNSARRVTKVKEEINVIALSSNGEKMLSYSVDGIIKEWDLKSAECIELYLNSELKTDTTYLNNKLFKQKKLSYDDVKITQMQYLSNESECAISLSDGNMCILNTKTKQCIWKLQHVPGINVFGCDFNGAEFETDDLKSMIKTYGGIVL